uniref:Fatty acyl-CoA reductase C-terminal domain-containing protein n=1 Tax=Timema douglasi TaxID=61478 RepID=A0A7R8VJ68_TIMDO|nr:unnamed protein product [Timema douglasi]
MCMLVKIYRKVDKHIHLLKYFSMYECNFDNQKCLSLYNSLGEKDKEIFYFNSNEIVWKDYLTRLVDGGRLYMLKESVDTIPEGKIRYMKFYIAHQTIKVLLYGLIAWILWSVVLRVKYMYFS